jgi:thiocyanate hydrolase subunit gamma
MTHDHDHDHDRTVKPMVDEITDFEVLEIALRELCIEKGIFTAEEHRRFTEFAEQIGPTPAARLVARAWLDPDFKALAIAEPLTASKEVGVDWLEPTGFGTPSDFTAFQILADTPTVHHVIVCALCSCYPRPILGNSPEWYRTPNYRRRLVRHPRQRPEGTDDWTEDQLTEIITRDCLIGVALPRVGVTTNIVDTRLAMHPSGE